MNDYDWSHQCFESVLFVHVKIILEGILNNCLLQAMKNILVVKDNLKISMFFSLCFWILFFATPETCASCHNWLGHRVFHELYDRKRV